MNLREVVSELVTPEMRVIDYEDMHDIDGEYFDVVILSGVLSSSMDMKALVEVITNFEWYMAEDGFVVANYSSQEVSEFSPSSMANLLQSMFKVEIIGGTPEEPVWKFSKKR